MQSTLADHTGQQSPRRRTAKRNSSGDGSYGAYGAYGADAEKERDDLTMPPPARPGVTRSQASVSDAVSRLFVTQVSPPQTSRENSFHQTQPSLTYSRETPSLGSHLHGRGLLQGKHSDIIIICFGTRYYLHCLVLDRAPFFSSLLSPPWLESSSKEIALRPEETDSNVTKRGFELALRRLYGSNDPAEEEPEHFSLLATGSWLEMQDLVDDMVDAIIRSLHAANAGFAMTLLSTNEYGAAGDKILTAAKLILCREGSSALAAHWSQIPSEMIRELINHDCFFAKSEYDRWQLAKDILNAKLLHVAQACGVQVTGKVRAHRRIRRNRAGLTEGTEDSDSEGEVSEEQATWTRVYTHEDILPLLHLLDRGIYYVHLEFDQLEKIKLAVDVFSVPTVAPEILREALWAGMDLRRTVINADDSDVDLDLVQPNQAAQRSAGTFLHTTASPMMIRDDSGQEAVPQDQPDATRYYIPSRDRRKAFGPAKGRGLFDDKSTKADSTSLTSPSGDASRNATYTRFPPYRFAVEFPRIQSLKDKRIYSEKFFYAGSYWSIYIQKLRPSASISSVRKRNAGFGFYLHRLEHSSLEPAIQSVDQRINTLEGIMGNRAGQRSTWHQDSGTFYPEPESDDASPRLRTAIQLLMSPASARADAGSRPRTASTPFLHGDDADADDAKPFRPHKSQPPRAVPTLPRYIDARPTVQAYFKVYYSAGSGLLLHMCQSVPDSFNFTQSVGWPSSATLEEEMRAGAVPESPPGGGATHADADWAGDDDDVLAAARAVRSAAGRAMEGLRGTGPGPAAAAPDGLRFVLVLGLV